MLAFLDYYVPIDVRQPISATLLILALMLVGEIHIVLLASSPGHSGSLVVECPL